MKRPPFAFAALSLALGATGGPLQILPAGEFHAGDGPPADVASWRLDAAGAERIIRALRALSMRPVICYEHQTHISDQND
ncbi:MAG: hypothetical protein KDG55_11750 [Rhodocyclaceae bacterium]|nr:hypothetical protein [Rhodocyclaceae bacterium]